MGNSHLDAFMNLVYNIEADLIVGKSIVKYREDIDKVLLFLSKCLGDLRNQLHPEVFEFDEEVTKIYEVVLQFEIYKEMIRQENEGNA